MPYGRSSGHSATPRTNRTRNTRPAQQQRRSHAAAAARVSRPGTPSHARTSVPTSGRLSAPAQGRTSRAAARPGSRPTSRQGFSRRTLIKGALGLGAIAGAAGALSSLQGCAPQDADGAAAPSVVDDSHSTSVTDTYTYEDQLQGLTLAHEWTLPLGTVLLPAEGTWIPATTTGDSANPVVSASAFSLASGTLSTVVENPVSTGANYVIYAARCSDTLYAWVELDIIANNWALYAAPFSNGALTGTQSLLMEGDADWDIPAFAVSGNKLIWLMMPALSGQKTTESSICYLWQLGAAEATPALESPGRFACDPTISDGTVVLAPRVRPDEGVYYGISAFSLADNLASSHDQLVLPRSIKPFTAVWMGDHLAIQIEANYSSGGLLGNMGTYLALGDDNFITIAREPSAAPAGNPNTLIVKSRASYLVANLHDQTFSTLVAANRSVDYGEYPARQGLCQTFVTYCTVKDPMTSYPDSVKVREYTLV